MGTEVSTNPPFPVNFFFRTNIQGDVLAIFDRSTKAQVVSFNYDAWGNYTTTVSNATLSQIALNYTHLRYRGYYQDAETGLYYLNSRYYDAKMCRFINADSFDIIGATPDGLTDKNLYAYCDNNPIMRIDDGGEFWHIVVGAAVGAVVNFVTSLIQQSQSGEKINWAKAGISAAAGAISGALAATGAGPVVQIVANALVSGAESIINQGIDDGLDNIDYGEVVSDAVIGGLTSASNGVSKGTAKHLMTQGTNFTKQIANKGFKKATKYYYSQTATLFYKPLFKDAFNDIVDTIMKTERQKAYQYERIYG